MPSLPDDMLSTIKTEFDAACVDVFRSSIRRTLLAAPGQDLLPRFAQHYAHLCTLPRRVRRNLQRQWKRTLGSVALLLALTPGASFAATMNVAPGVAPDISADGKCSLIEAIVNANNNRATHRDCPAGSGTDTINLPTGSMQALTQMADTIPSRSDYYAVGLPEIRSPIVIEGRGSTIERSEGAPISLLIAVASSGMLTLNELTVSSAAPSDAYGAAAGIINNGALVLSGSSIVRSQGHYGSGLQNSGTATLRNSTVADNFGYVGGGIFNHAAATLTLTNSVVSGNRSTGMGGGITNRGTATLHATKVINNGSGYRSTGGGIENSGQLTVSSSVISGNQSRNDGGGLHNTGVAVITKTTIANNQAEVFFTVRGGGIASNGELTLVNSTVTGNAAPNCGGISVYGVSGIYSGTVTLTHTTVTGNVTTDRIQPVTGGGGLCVMDGATATLERSLISGNRLAENTPAGNAREIAVYTQGEDTPVVVANNFNVFGFSGQSGIVGFTPGATDVIPTKPLSGIVMPLANNGGLGATHALAIGSPALNIGPVDDLCKATDQRGNPRPQGVKCDIGAFEGSAVLCNGLVTTQVGTNLADTLTGTAGRDVIAGLAGNDTIRGLNYNDVICAGSGADKVYGGNGNDVLFGDANNDQLFGDAGNDALNGGTGTDKCVGGTGTDTATQCETRISVP